MAGATRRQSPEIGRRAPPERAGLGPYLPLAPVFPRQIDIAFASIADGDILPGELVYNEAGSDGPSNDKTLVMRISDTTIVRWTTAGGDTRTI